MANPTTIEGHYTTEFGTNWQHLAQQMMKRLEGSYIPDSVSGKEKSYNQIQSTSMRKITTRLGKTEPQDQVTEKRWLRPSAYECVDWFDEWDEKLLGSVVLPTSETTERHAMAKNRTCDEILIDALDTEESSVGDGGTDTQAFDANNIVAVNFVKPGATAVNTGLTLAKLIKAKSILGENEAYEHQGADSRGLLFAAVTQQMLDNLLYDVDQVSSKDYNAVQALVEGQVDHFMGFRFLRSEQMPWENEANDIKRALFWHRSAVVMSDGGDNTYIDVLPQQRHTLQIRSTAWLGATRLDEAKVVRVLVDQTP